MPLALVWDNVYGFNMSAIKEQALHEPLVDTVDQNSICSHVHQLIVRTFFVLWADQR